MMDDATWDDLLSGITDAARVELVTELLGTFFRTAPGACLTCLEKASSAARDPTLRERSLVVMKKPFGEVQLLPPEIRGPVNGAAVEALLQLAQGAEGTVLQNVADLFSLIFVKNRTFPPDVIGSLFGSRPEFAIKVFAEFVEEMNEEQISANAQGLFALATGLLEVDFMASVEVIIAVLGVDHPEFDWRGVAEFMRMKLYGGQCSDNELSPCAFVITGLMNEGVIDVTETERLMTWASENAEDERLNMILLAFEDLVDRIPTPVLQQMMALAIKTAVVKLQEEGSMSDLGFCRVVLERTQNVDVISEAIARLATVGWAEQCVSLFLVGFVIRYCQASDNTVASMGMLTAGLSSDNEIVRRSALQVIKSIEIGRLNANTVSMMGDLITTVLAMLESKPLVLEQTVLAICAMDNFFDGCDAEIDGMFERVWKLAAAVTPDQGAPEYMSLMCNVVNLMEALDDEHMEQIIAWLDGMLKMDNPELKARSLKMAAILISKEQSLSALLLPTCAALLPGLLSYENSEVVGDTLCFLAEIAEALSEESVGLIQPVLPLVLNHVANISQGDVTPSARYALNTLACFASVTGQMVNEVAETVERLLGDSERPYSREVACNALLFLGRDEKMAALPNVKALFERLVAAIVGKCEISELEHLFKAAGLVFKRCYRSDPAFFLPRATSVVQRELARSENGMSIFEDPQFSDVIDEIMVFISRVFKSGLVEVDTICRGLLTTMVSVNLKVQFALLGTLSDAVEHCAVSGPVIGETCAFLIATAPTVNDIDMRHNIVYFMSMLMRKYPEQLEPGCRMYPFIQQWWTSGLGKKSGCEELLDNCASFFLSFAVANPTGVADDVLIAATSRFPPLVDIHETQSMIGRVCSILQQRRESCSPELAASIAKSFARLLTEPDSKTRRRKIQSEDWESCKAAFRILMSNQHISDVVAAAYRSKRAKFAAIQRLLK